MGRRGGEGGALLPTAITDEDGRSTNRILGATGCLRGLDRSAFLKRAPPRPGLAQPITMGQNRETDPSPQDSIRAFSVSSVFVVGSYSSLISTSPLTTPSNSAKLPSSRCLRAAAITAPSASASSDIFSRALATATRPSGARIPLGKVSDANHRLAPVARAARSGAGSGVPATGVDSRAAIRQASATSRPRPSGACPAYVASARKGKTIGPTAKGGTEARMGRVREYQRGNGAARGA